MEIQKRNITFDLLKGIGVIFVILGHMPSLVPENIRLWIFSFHMPLFFFSSGFFYSEKSTIEKKIKSLLIPYLIYSFVFLALDMLLLKNDRAYFDEKIIRIIYGQGGADILWFFTSLFIVSLLFIGLKKFVKHSLQLYIFVSIFVVMGYIAHHYGINYWKISTSCYALGFFFIGYLMKNNLYIYIGYLKEKGLLGIIGSCGIFFVFSILGSILLIRLNHNTLDLNNAVYFDIVLNYLTSLCGIFAFLLLCNSFEKVVFLKPLAFIGKHSIIFFPLTNYIPNLILILCKSDGLMIKGFAYFTSFIICAIFAFLIDRLRNTNGF